MRLSFTTVFSFCLCSSLYAQITYTYVEPDPGLEADKKTKAVYFKQLRDDAFTNLTNCVKPCRGADNAIDPPNPCNKSDAYHVCLCTCQTRYESTIKDINRQEQDWLRTAAQRQKDYENKKIKEQRQQDLQNQQKVTEQDRLNQLQQQLDEQQRRYQQTQIELDNAKNVSMSAYQEAISSSKKESGAMLDATLAGAQQITDAKSSLIYTGVGLGLSLFMHLSEKKAEKQQKELELQQEEERKKLIIETKKTFIREALDINKYGFADLISKSRYATLLLVPKIFNPDEQSIFFTYPIQVMKYADSTYPLKPEVEKKLLAASDKSITKDKSVYLLYPIVGFEKFTNDFVKKMGSGKVIYLNARLLHFARNPFVNDDMQNGNTDFWGNPFKNNNKPKSGKSAKDDFWNN